MSKFKNILSALLSGAAAVDQLGLFKKKRAYFVSKPNLTWKTGEEHGVGTGKKDVSIYQVSKNTMMLMHSTKIEISDNSKDYSRKWVDNNIKKGEKFSLEEL